MCPPREWLDVARSKIGWKCFHGYQGVLKRVPNNSKTSPKRVFRDFSKWKMILLGVCWYSLNTFLHLQGRAAAESRRLPLEVAKHTQKSTKTVPKGSFFIYWNIGALSWDSFLILWGLFWGRISIHGSTFSAELCFWLNQVFPWEGTL